MDATREVVEITFYFLPFILPFASLVMMVCLADHIVMFLKRIIKTNSKLKVKF